MNMLKNGDSVGGKHACKTARRDKSVAVSILETLRHYLFINGVH